MPKKAKSKTDEAIEIGETLPKSKATEEFLKSVNMDSKKDEPKNKTKKGTPKATPKKGTPKAKTSSVKVKGWEGQKEQPTPVPKIRPVIEWKVIDTVYLLPEELDNLHYQPRGNYNEPLPNAFIDNLSDGNFQAVCAQFVKDGMPRVMDGHRRRIGIAKVNERIKDKSKKVRVKVDIYDTTDIESAIFAFRSNLDAKTLEGTDRDKYVYYLVTKLGMTANQVDEYTPISKQALSNIVRVFEKGTESVIKAIDDGIITTAHAKALVSLPPKEQKQIMKKVEKAEAKQDPLTVRDVEQEAKAKRSRLEVISRMEQHILRNYTKDGKALKAVPDLEGFYTQIIQDTFEGGATYTNAHYGYWVTTTDAKIACRQAKLTVLQQVSETGEPVKVEKTPLCLSCVGYCKGEGKCIHTNTDAKAKPLKYDECPKYFAGKPIDQYRLYQCTICGHPIFEAGKTAYTYSNVVPLTNGYNSSFRHIKVKGDIMAHSSCAIKHTMEQTKLVGGACATCANGNCKLIRDISGKLTAGIIIEMKIAKCPEFIQAEDLDKTQKKASFAWSGLQKEQQIEIKTAEAAKAKSEKEAAKAKAKAEAAKAKIKAEKEAAKAKAQAEKEAKIEAKAKAKAEAAKKKADTEAAKAKLKAEKEAKAEATAKTKAVREADLARIKAKETSKKTPTITAKTVKK